MIEAMKHYEAALLKAFPKGAFGDVFEHWNKARQAIAEAEKQEPTSGFFSREAMKEHSDFHPQPKQEQDKPVALVTGVYGGRFTYAPIKASVVLPVGMALYTHPQQRTWVDLTGEELETLLRENRTLTLDAIWAVADKLKEKNCS